MHVCWNRWVSLMLITILWLAALVDAKPRLQAVCDNPKGVEIHYGSGLWELDDGTIATSPTEYPGAQLIFLIEHEQPQTLVVMWRQSPAALDRSEDGSQLYNANIVVDTPSQLTAIHQHKCRLGPDRISSRWLKIESRPSTGTQ